MNFSLNFCCSAPISNICTYSLYRQKISIIRFFIFPDFCDFLIEFMFFCSDFQPLYLYILFKARALNDMIQKLIMMIQFSLSSLFQHSHKKIHTPNFTYCIYILFVAGALRNDYDFKFKIVHEPIFTPPCFSIRKNEKKCSTPISIDCIYILYVAAVALNDRDFKFNNRVKLGRFVIST